MNSRCTTYSQLTSYVTKGLDRVDRTFYRLDVQDDRRLRSKYKLKQGSWLHILNKEDPTIHNAAIGTIDFFKEAKELDDKWYKSWHMWAMINFKAAQPEKLKDLKDEYKSVDERIRQLQGVPGMGGLDMEDEDDDYEFEDDDDIDSDDEVFGRRQ